MSPRVEALRAEREALLVERERLTSQVRGARAAKVQAVAAVTRAESGLESVSARLHEVEHGIAAARAESGGLEITDRAILRYLELVDGFDFEPVRKRIIDAINASEARSEGSLTVNETRGVRILSRDGRVIGITPVDEDREGAEPCRFKSGASPRSRPS